MAIDEIVSLFVNNGGVVACLVYFIVRDYKFMNTLNETLNTLKDSVTLIQEHFLNEHSEDLKK